VRRLNAGPVASCVAIGIGLIALAGCGGGSRARQASGLRVARSELAAYLSRVEPIRLAVNRLLGGADPILVAFHDARAAPAQAARRMGALERRFAEYTADVAAINPAATELRALHSAYAETYLLEDAYLSALTNGLADRNLANLPNTQAAQRAAIIRWRTGLTVLARNVGFALPADLQQAGRGEIAPAPGG
jgi:hypothetical protein